MGTRLMTSTPQATATSTAPPATMAAARLVACWDDPHWVSTVVPATWSGQPGGEPGGAGDVEGLLADLADAAADDLADLGRVDAGAIDQRLLGDAEQLARVHGGQAAAPAAHGRADGIDDHDVGHGDTLRRLLTGRSREPGAVRLLRTSRAGAHDRRR